MQKLKYYFVSYNYMQATTSGFGSCYFVSSLPQFVRSIVANEINHIIAQNLSKIKNTTISPNDVNTAILYYKEVGKKEFKANTND